MNPVIYLVVGAAIAIACLWAWDQIWSFRAQRLNDYANERPTFDLMQTLNQRFTAHGVIFDYSGRANTRFSAELSGAFDADGGVLAERFRYDGMDVVDTREWQIRFTSPTSFTATAADVVGVGRGEISGNAVRMTYRLHLPERAGSHVLDVVDWLYLMEDGTVVNRSEMRKFGFRAAELFAVFQPVSVTDR